MFASMVNHDGIVGLRANAALGQVFCLRWAIAMYKGWGCKRLRFMKSSVTCQGLSRM